MKRIFILMLIVVGVLSAISSTFAEYVIVKGIIEKSDRFYYIKSENDIFYINIFDCVIPPNEECPLCRLGELVGTQVEVTGAVKEENGSKMITVYKLQWNGTILLPCRTTSEKF